MKPSIIAALGLLLGLLTACGAQPAPQSNLAPIGPPPAAGGGGGGGGGGY